MWESESRIIWRGLLQSLILETLKTECPILLTGSPYLFRACGSVLINHWATNKNIQNPKTKKYKTESFEIRFRIKSRGSSVTNLFKRFSFYLTPDQKKVLWTLVIFAKYGKYCRIYIFWYFCCQKFDKVTTFIWVKGFVWASGLSTCRTKTS